MTYTDLELESYLDEALPTEEMARIEQEARRDPSLLRRLAEINRRRDGGAHSLAAVWRRHCVSCPSRTELGAYLLDALDPDVANFVLFHLTDVGCRYCQANVDDLKAEQNQDREEVQKRRTNYFQSSAGFLKR